jgi:hypothetical protein
MEHNRSHDNIMAGLQTDNSIRWCPHPTDAGKHLFRFTPISNPDKQKFGYECTCFHHPPDIPLHSKTGVVRHCTRGLSLDSDGSADNIAEVRDACLRTLKTWCLGAFLPSNGDRARHMNTSYFPKKVPVPLPTTHELEERMECQRRSLL